MPCVVGHLLEEIAGQLFDDVLPSTATICPKPKINVMFDDRDWRSSTLDPNPQQLQQLCEVAQDLHTA